MNGYFETVSNPEVIKPEKKLITLRHYPDQRGKRRRTGKRDWRKTK